MRFVIIAAAVLSVVCVLLWGRFVVKRISMAGKLKKACEKNGCRIYPAHPLWMLGCQCGRKCDFYVETKYYIYSVKLFGVLGKKNILIFTDNQRYFYRKAAGARQMSEPSDGRIRTLKPFDFKHKYRDEWQSKIPRCVLLVNPVAYELRTRLESNQGKEEIVSPGATVNGMLIHKLSSFTEQLDERDYGKSSFFSSI